MKDYLLHTLSPGDFETLVVKLCHQILGLGTITFSTGKDGGRDAFFEGTAARFPSQRDPWSGKFVIQAKHTEKADASCSNSDFARLLKAEVPKVAAHRRKSRCDCYLLFTNRKLGALTEEKLVGELQQETGVANVAILGKETLTSYLDDAPRIAEALNLQVAPFVAGLPTIAPPTRDFAGRIDELEELRRQVREHGGAVIYGVRGLGGIGKTELCRKLVAEIGDDYPDGHVLVDLRGASDKPLSASEALAEVIRTYEPQARLPEAQTDLRRLYYQVLKDRRAIVFLDDAAGAEQVEPLLPHSGCLTLVTSRRRFSLPALHRLDLDALTPEAARELLLSLAPRLDGEADRIAELLGRLPLALRLAGSAFAERPDLEADEYVHKLESRPERVGLMEAAIDFNYRALDADLQQRWRTLAVFVGGFDAQAAAAVWDLPVDASKGILGGALYPVSLVEWRWGRYRLHDLARDFAAHRLEGEERQSMARRHAGHYVNVLKEVDCLYHKGGERILDGLALFDREWSNIESGQAWATAYAESDREAARYSSSYASASTYYLYVRLHPDAWLRWLDAGRSATVALKDRRGEAAILGSLGNACTMLGKVGKAIGFYKQTLEIARELGEEYIENFALIGLGNAYTARGGVVKAFSFYEQALVIARRSGDRRGELVTLGNLSMAYYRLGNMNKAISLCDQSLLIAREIGHRRGEGNALTGLGLAFDALGEVDKGIGFYERHLVIAREIGDREGENTALGNLGMAYGALGQTDKAIGYIEQQLFIAREIGDRRSEGTALGNLGRAYHRLKEMDKAIGYSEQALTIAREISDRRGEGRALGNLGLAYADVGEGDKAIPLMEQALEIGQAIKDPRIVDPVSKKLEELRGS